jgi:hypothetical protein
MKRFRDPEEYKIGHKIVILAVLLWSAILLLTGAYTIINWIIKGIFY